MTRGKRLSPRRASSRLPLSPRQTQVRLKPLLFLRPLPPKGGTPIRETSRFRTHYEYPIFDARPESLRSSVRLRRMSSRPTARRASKSTVCGLNGLRPSLAGLPPFKSSTPDKRGSCSGASLRRAQTGNSRSRFGKKNCASLTFLSKTESKRFRERRGTKAMTPTETVTAI
jgi:hypothetical protein